MLIRKRFTLQKLTIHICHWHTVRAKRAPAIFWENVLLFIPMKMPKLVDTGWITNLEKVFHVLVQKKKKNLKELKNEKGKSKKVDRKGGQREAFQVIFWSHYSSEWLPFVPTWHSRESLIAKKRGASRGERGASPPQGSVVGLRWYNVLTTMISQG